MKRMTIFGLAAALLMVPAACSSQAEEQSAQANNSASGKAAPPAGDRAAALEAHEIRLITARTADPASNAAEAFGMIYNGQASTKIEIGEEEYDTGPVALARLGGNRWILLSAGAGEACHACSGVNVVDYVEDREGGYARTAQFLDVGVVGTMGNAASEWAISNDLAEHPVLITRSGGVWQGYSCDVVNLTELAPGGPVNRGTFPIAYSDTGARGDGGSAQSLEGHIYSGQRGVDFTIRVSGTSSYTQHYRRNGERYELQGGNAMPTC